MQAAAGNQCASRMHRTKNRRMTPFFATAQFAKHHRRSQYRCRDSAVATTSSPRIITIIIVIVISRLCIGIMGNGELGRHTREGNFVLLF